MEELVKCDYCFRMSKFTRECVIKEANAPGVGEPGSPWAIKNKWSDRKMNLCTRCRTYLRGFFKYVR